MPTADDAGPGQLPSTAAHNPTLNDPPQTADPLATRYTSPGGAPRPQSALPAPPAAGLPRRFGDYELLAEVARGGMGVVYRARHLVTDRVVALKMVLAGDFATAADVERFRREARNAAALEHPGIVPIYDVGEAEGRQFYTMPFVAGGSLQDRLAEGPLPPPLAARLVWQLAEAVQHAHDKGIIHRDLKPRNVVLHHDGASQEGSTSAETPRPGSGKSGRGDTGGVAARLTDFGLARAAAGDGLTATGDVLGTPAYMAPEQAAGDTKRTGPCSDVYGLGAVLYALLTGRPPFQAATPLETMRQVREVEPVAPRRLNPGVPAELETVCLKCLEKDPGRRYASAAALAEDLRRFGAGEPVLAVPAGPLTRAAKWVRRRPVIAGLLAAVVLVAAAGAGGVAWAYSRALDALADARAEKRERLRKQAGQLRTASAAAVPVLLAALESERAEVLPHLRELWAAGGDEGGRAGRMRLVMALLPDEPGLRDELAAWMLEADDPGEVLLARDALKASAADLAPALWARAGDAKAPDAARFRALAALAAFDPQRPGWRESAPFAAGQLLRANPLFLGVWAQALRPASGALLAPLGDVFRGRVLADMRQVAAEVLADYARDRPEALADLAADSAPEQLAVLLPRLAVHRARVAEVFKEELGRTPSGKPAEADRVALARRQSAVAAALLRLGEGGDAAWPLLRQTPTPDARSYLVRDLALRGVEVRDLVRRLEGESDVSARRALVLALGDYGEDRLPPELRAGLVPKLLDWYRHDPDPGVHGAVDWLLRHGREGPTPRRLDWGQAAALAAIDRELAGRPPSAGARWLVTNSGDTMTLVPGPVEFTMGSPPEETGRVENEIAHRRRIGRGFALASRAVTVARWKEFLRSGPPGVPTNSDDRYSPEEDCPINVVNWFAAAKFCRWLSEREGVPEDQMCYPRMADIKEGMRMPAGYLGRTGYRLPTEAEWEYACRAGSATAYHFGGGEDLLPRYGWFRQNSGARTWPVGQKPPNDLGLFDMYGNVWTWCQGAIVFYPAGPAPAEDKEDLRVIDDSVHRVLRGGTFDERPSVLRSSFRGVYRPSHCLNSFGLRVARTYR